MISGTIAVIIVIAAVIPSIADGDAGTAITGIVISLFFLFFGMIGRKEDKAYMNMIDYWAGKDEK